MQQDDSHEWELLEAADVETTSDEIVGADEVASADTSRPGWPQSASHNIVLPGAERQGTADTSGTFARPRVTAIG